MSRLLHFCRNHRLFVAALYRLLLLLPLLSGEIVLSMISIAGLTLTTLPPFARFYRKPAAPQLEQRIEKEVFDESALSHSIRTELARAAELLPSTQTTSPLEKEIVEAEWEEEQTAPVPIEAIEEHAKTEVATAVEIEHESPPEELPEEEPIETVSEALPFSLPDYPFQPVDLQSPQQRPTLPRYPAAVTPLTLDPVSSTATLPHYPMVETGLSGCATTPHHPPLPDYPRASLNLIAHDEEEPFEEEPLEPIEEMEEDEEDLEWMPTRERADALLAVCQLYSQMEDTEIPLTVLIGGTDEDELLQLSSESLDGAIHLKEQIDEMVEIFGFNNAQRLFDHLFYCSIAADRADRLQSLLSTLTPIVMESMMINNSSEREVLYQQIFDHLFEAGEFLSMEREVLFRKWHEEFIPSAPPQEKSEEAAEEFSPEEAFTPASESAQERIAAALENLQQQQELELSTPEQQQHASVEQERERLTRKRKISRIDHLAQQQGLPLEQLLEEEPEHSEESEQLLNLLLSARSDPAEEYIHFHGHLKGTPADLLIESLLRIKLQNRTCNLYRQLHHLDDYELIEQRIFDQLQQEFGEIVLKNHRRSIEQHIEWASSSGRPHCNDHLLPQPVEL